MRLGNLRTLVTIQQQTVGQDHFSSLVKPAWQHVTEAWLALEPLSGQELMIAQQAQSQTTHKACMHWQPGLDAKMRLVTADGRVFQIEALMNPGEMNRELELRLVERQLADNERQAAIDSLTP